MEHDGATVKNQFLSCYVLYAIKSKNSDFRPLKKYLESFDNSIFSFNYIDQNNPEKSWKSGEKTGKTDQEFQSFENLINDFSKSYSY